MSIRRDLFRPLDACLLGPVAYRYEIAAGLRVLRDGSRVIYEPELIVYHHATSDLSEYNLAVARVVNHNQTYVLLKHLNLARRATFLLYTLTVGDRGTMGTARALFGARPGDTFSLARANLGSTLAGAHTFWRARRRAALRPQFMPPTGELR